MIDEIEPRAVRALKSEIEGKGFSPAWVTRVVGLLRTTLRLAVNDGLIPRDPTAGIRLSRARIVDVDPFTLQEMNLILYGRPKGTRDPETGEELPEARGVDLAYREFFEVLFFTGMRPSEAVALRWEGVDFIRGTVSIRAGRVRGVDGPTKTPGSARDAAMLNAESAFRRMKEKTFLAGGYVFLTPQGTALDQTNLRNRLWYPALKRLGLRRRAMYQIRHSFVTLSLEVGENPLWIAAQVGHTSAAMIFRHYAKWIPRKGDGSALMRRMRGGQIGPHMVPKRKAKVVGTQQRVGLSGGAEGDRTPDLMTASHALSHLSYSPNLGRKTDFTK